MAPPYSPKRPYITPQTEAFAVVMIKNCCTKWPLLLKEKQKSKAPVHYMKGPVTKSHANLNYIDITAKPEFMGKYSSFDAGQQHFGGWKMEGIKHYKELVALNKEACSKPETLVLEKEILDRLRADNGIQGSNWAEYKTLIKGKKPALEVYEVVEDLFDWDNFQDPMGVATKKASV